MRRKQKTVDTARRLRQADVPAEAVLWRVLRNRGLGGFKFRRQHPIGPFVADFACDECRLAIELDGESHLGQTQRDERRTAVIESDGWQVLRIWNNAVYDEMESVREAIYRACVTRSAR